MIFLDRPQRILVCLNSRVRGTSLSAIHPIYFRFRAARLTDTQRASFSCAHFIFRSVDQNPIFNFTRRQGCAAAILDTRVFLSPEPSVLTNNKETMAELFSRIRSLKPDSFQSSVRRKKAMFIFAGAVWSDHNASCPHFHLSGRTARLAG